MYHRKDQEASLAKIQKKREEMIYFGEKYGLTAMETVKCSTELDEMLNEYYRNFQLKRPVRNATVRQVKLLPFGRNVFANNYVAYK